MMMMVMMMMLMRRRRRRRRTGNTDDGDHSSKIHKKRRQNPFLNTDFDFFLLVQMGVRGRHCAKKIPFFVDDHMVKLMFSVDQNVDDQVNVSRGWPLPHSGDCVPSF